jgi:hypothetical protein
VGLIDECVKAFVQVGFDPGADGAFMELQMGCNLGNAPACRAEADHLQAVSCAGDQTALMSALVEFLTYGLC